MPGKLVCDGIFRIGSRLRNYAPFQHVFGALTQGSCLLLEDRRRNLDRIDLEIFGPQIRHSEIPFRYIAPIVIGKRRLRR